MPHRIRRRPPPESVDTTSSLTGLRAIAVFEALKGVVAIALGAGLLALLHRDIEHVAEQLLVHMHIGLEHQASQAFLRLARGMDDGRIWAIAGGALAYTAVRFTEAYGLWNRRVWAEWFALLSGTLYLPWEIYSVSMHPNLLHYAVFATNVGIVLYMVHVRVRACRSFFECEEEPEREAAEPGIDDSYTTTEKEPAQIEDPRRVGVQRDA